MTSMTRLHPMSLLARPIAGPIAGLIADLALAGRPRLVTGIPGVPALFAVANDWAVLHHSASRALANVGTDTLWLTAAVAAALSYRNWRGWQRSSSGCAPSWTSSAPASGCG